MRFFNRSGDVRKTVPSPSPEQVRQAIGAYSRANQRANIDENMDRFRGNDALENALRATSDMLRVAYSDISWEYGNLVQQVSFMEPLRKRVPLDISQGMPPNVKEHVVRQLWNGAALDAQTDLQNNFNEWKKFLAVHLNQHDPLRAVYEVTRRYIALSFFQFRADFRATRTRWEGLLSVSSEHKKEADQWDRAMTSLAEKLEVELSILYYEKQGALETLAFTPEMFAFLRTSDYAG